MAPIKAAAAVASPGPDAIDTGREASGLGASEVAFSLVDQATFSVSHFLLNILLARWLMPRVYGSFAFGFSALLLVAAFYGAVTTEPLLMFGASRFRGRFRAYLGVVLVYHCKISLGIVLLGGLASYSAFAFGSAEAGWALAGVAIVTPVLLLSWLLRPACYVLRKPGWAAVSGAIYLIVLIASLSGAHALGLLTAFVAYLSMTAASLTACIVLMLFLRPQMTPISKAFANEIWQAHLGFGGLNLIAASFIWLSGQIVVFLIPFFMGFNALAATAAALNFYRPLHPIMRSVSSLFLPHSARLVSSSEGTRALRRQSTRFIAWSALVVLGYTFFLTGFAHPIYVHLYKGKYNSNAGMVLLLGLAYTGSILVQADGIVLKAAGKIRTVVWIWVVPAVLTSILSIPALLTKNLTVVFAVYAASYLTAAIIARFVTNAALADRSSHTHHPRMLLPASTRASGTVANEVSAGPSGAKSWGR